MSFLSEKALRYLKIRENDQNLRVIKNFTGFIENFVDFTHNDYLNLSTHINVKKGAQEYLEKYGSSGRSSRLLNFSDLYLELEEILKKYKKTDKIILFSSGYQANSSTVYSILKLFKENEIDVFSDRLNHNSIHSGINLARKGQIRYKNTDLNHLEFLLKKSVKKYKIVITESVFSMDGSVLDIDNFIYLKRKYNFAIYLDEAHSFGLYGNEGMGFSPKYKDEIEISMNTLSKAVGSQGGFIATCENINDYLINFAPGAVYSTCLSPPCIGASISSLKLIPKLEEERANIFYLSKTLRNLLKQSGIKTFDSSSHIVPIYVNDNKEADNLQKYLYSQKILTYAIKYPTVPLETQRLRVSLNSSHKLKDITKLAKCIKDFYNL